jgi:hypothetical protein
MLHKICNCVSQLYGHKNESTHSWVCKNKLSAETRASVIPVPFPVALEEVVDECLRWNGVGFGPKRQE